jgi:hypothetical protein
MKTLRNLAAGPVGIILATLLASQVRAADPALEAFKAEIDAIISGLAPGPNGVLQWVGADPFEIRRDGDTLVATITGARLIFHADEAVRLVLDRFEIRQTAAQDGKGLAVLPPKQVIFAGSAGSQAKLTLEDGRVDALIDATSGRVRAMAVAITSARVDHPTTGAWLSTGPLAITSKLVTERDGRWVAPTEFELKKVEFSFPQAAGAGAINRIAFSGISAGPKVTEFERLRDALATLDKDKRAPPEARLANLLATLPTIPSVFSTVRGDTVLEGLSVRDNAGEALASLSRVEFATGESGLDDDVAAFRFTIREDGLKLAPSLVEARLVPHRVIIDFGVENLSRAALSTLLSTATLTWSGGGTE